MFGGSQLTTIIQTDFELNWSGKISFAELNAFAPWERDIYISMHINKLKEEKENQK